MIEKWSDLGEIIFVEFTDSCSNHVVKY